MKQTKLILTCIILLTIYIMTSCTKETIHTKETVTNTVQTYYDNAIIIDTFINRPYTWLSYKPTSRKLMMQIDSVNAKDAVDIYWGGNDYWHKLPFVDTENNVTLYYEWFQGHIIFFADGDSTFINNKSYWDKIGWDWARVKITKKR